MNLSQDFAFGLGCRLNAKRQLGHWNSPCGIGPVLVWVQSWTGALFPQWPQVILNRSSMSLMVQV